MYVMSSITELPELIGSWWRAAPGLTSVIRPCVLRAASIAPGTPASAQEVAQPSMQEQTLKARDVFKDCANCPEMVVVPAGSVKMGSPTSEPGHSAEEGPHHLVTI